MDHFEYISVAVSILIALALTELIGGWARMLRARARTPPHGLHLGWMVIVFLVLVQFWWVFWEYGSAPEWTFVTFLLVLLPPTTAVFAVALISPTADEFERPGFSLRAFYFARSRNFFLTVAAYQTELVVQSLVFFGVRPVILAGQLAGVATGVVLASTRNERIHRAVAVVALVILASFVTLVRFRI
jgi:hypothetical protein